MTTRARRVLWLLNHTTLMKTEIPILRAMGYEVFAPKVLPTEAWFRSGSVDYSCDKSLTIPSEVLHELNSADLYMEPWSERVVAYMNTYFGALFIMPLAISLQEGLQKFEGAVLLRAFGLDASVTYAGLLNGYHQTAAFEWIYAIRDRFWFAAGYEQLSEVEPRIIADRDVFLPVAMPATFERHRDTWTGGSKEILFVCPNIRTNPYYAKVYEDFKRDFGDFPHVIIGAQNDTVDDPHVLGFVSDEKFIELLQHSDVMYYHSHEPRHVHYTPIEGAEVGTPVVLYKHNLVARMIGRDISGAVSTVAEARAKIAAILEGDLTVIDKVREDQRILGTLFSEEYCLRVWEQSFVKSGISQFLKQIDQRPSAIDWKLVTNRRVPRKLMLFPNQVIDNHSTFNDGIDFTSEDYPAFVEFVEGAFWADSWGSWSDGDMIEIGVSTPVGGTFDLIITGGAYGKNLDEPIGIQVGSVRKHLKLSSAPWEPTTVTVPFFLFEPAQTIKIWIPYPTPLAGTPREIGVGLTKIAVRSTPDPDNDWFNRLSHSEPINQSK